MDTSEKYDFPENRFTAWDYVMFALLLTISSAIGLYYACSGGKQKTTKEFLMAGRQMKIFPVAMSLIASFMSAITLLGTPAEIVIFGTQYWLIWIGYIIMFPIAIYIFIPIFYSLELTSVFEYLEMRYSKGVRRYMSVVYVFQTMLYMAMVLYAPCLALSVVTGLNKWVAVISIGVVCTFYTTVGGMKAVMWTDVVQTILMFAGLIAVLIKGSIDHGGFGNIWRYMYEGDRINFFEFSPDPLIRHTIWSLSLGAMFSWLVIYGVNQAQVQRALCTKTLREGQIALWINLPGLTLLLTVCSLCGMVVYAEYRDCDPIKSGRIQGRDQLLPLYVMDRLYYPGVPGIFTACIFSGALSTISSGLNSLSAVVLQDFVREICFKGLSESRATLASKILSIIFGATMIVLTFVAAQVEGLLEAALGLFGMVGGPSLGIFVLALLYPWSNSKGAYVGLTSGLALTLWLGIGAQIYKPPIKGHVPPPLELTGCPLANITDLLNTTELTSATTTSWFNATTMLITSPTPPPPLAGYIPFYQLSYMWYGAFAVFVTTLTGLITSFLTGHTRLDDLDPRLISPVCDVLCCLPSSWRTRRRLLNEQRKLKQEKCDDKKGITAENGVCNNGYVTEEKLHPPNYPATTADYLDMAYNENIMSTHL